jgi:alanine racemase
LSFRDEADVLFIKRRQRAKALFYISKQGTSYKFKIPFQDTASIENAISCLMALLYFDYDIATIQSRMLLFPVESD